MADDKPYLGIWSREGPGRLGVRPVPEGSIISIHENENKEIGPLALVKIKVDYILLRCVCGQPRCNLTLKLKVERGGHHPLPGGTR